MPALDLSMVRTAIAAPRFDPRALFAGGARGGWYDPDDLASMAQTSDGATPAAIDAPVGLIRDKSPCGNDLTQPVATARPILRRDGRGRTYLAFDGIDDTLFSASPDFGFMDSFALATAIRFEGGTAYASFCGASATNTGWDVGMQNGLPRATARGSATIDTGAGSGSLPTITNRNAIVTIQFTPDAITRSIGGVRETTAGRWAPIAANAPFSVGQRGNDGSSRFTGRVYGYLVLDRAVTSAERGLIEAWMGEKA